MSTNKFLLSPFQDYVQQAMRYRDEDNIWQKVSQMLTAVEMRVCNVHNLL